MRPAAKQKRTKRGKERCFESHAPYRSPFSTTLCIIRPISPIFIHTDRCLSAIPVCPYFPTPRIRVVTTKLVTASASLTTLAPRLVAGSLTIRSLTTGAAVRIQRFRPVTPNSFATTRRLLPFAAEMGAASRKLRPFAPNSVVTARRLRPLGNTEFPDPRALLLLKKIS